MTTTYRVLTVEDDPDTMELMRLVLRNLPLEMVHAQTGAEAIAYLADHVPHLMFLDLHLPDMRGWEVMDHYKSDPRLNQLSVIVVTSHSDPVHRLIGTLQPIKAFLRKPVEAESLRRTVREALGLL